VPDFSLHDIALAGCGSTRFRLKHGFFTSSNLEAMRRGVLAVLVFFVFPEVSHAAGAGKLKKFCKGTGYVEIRSEH
jgi:hypothetical protein